MSNPIGPTDSHPLDDLAAHALDALDPTERRTVDDHLDHCAACRAELAHHHETLAALAPADAPPPAVWQGIADAIGASDLADPYATGGSGMAALDAPPSEATPTPRPNGTAGAGHATDESTSNEATGRATSAAAYDATGPSTSDDTGGTVSSLTDRRGGTSSLRWLAAAACLLVAAALGGIFGFALGESDDEADIAALAERASQDPDGVLGTLANAAGQPVARVAVDEDGAYLVLDGLDDLPEGRAYQLWALDGPAPVSLGMLGRDGTNTVAFRLPPTITELAISVAPTAGDPAPLGDFQAEGAVTPS